MSAIIIDGKFVSRKIYPEKGNLTIGVSNIDLAKYDKSFNIFNFEIDVSCSVFKDHFLRCFPQGLFIISFTYRYVNT